MKRKIIIFLILILGVLGCKSIDITNSKKKLALEETRIRALVMNELETRYDEKFEIRRTLYDKRRDKWKLEIYPLENNINDETFIAYVKYGKIVLEDYYFMKVTDLATIYYKSTVNKIFKEKKIYYLSSIGSYAKEKLDKKKKIYDILKKYSKESFITFKILIFEDVTSTEEKKEAFIKEVWELFKYLKSQNLKWASITINIYDEDFFKDKDTDHILKVSNWFSRGTSEFDVFKYRDKMIYNLIIWEQDYKRIKTLSDIRNELYKIEEESE
ncbi:hypothetical protein [Haliovirga abyssi]|uniref:Lipoprotein n=1 Tax=Haliovirga abyssi TaxID=2996794 RepID=A0AAU9DGR1_9FUSO|nr:hypothetical protein [Haliovirga abyssi]BDU50632.1 hypothetical protein HLVA_12010 [Haliovirga abyssi]